MSLGVTLFSVDLLTAATCYGLDSNGGTASCF